MRGPSTRWSAIALVSALAAGTTWIHQTADARPHGTATVLHVLTEWQDIVGDGARSAVAGTGRLPTTYSAQDLRGDLIDAGAGGWYELRLRAYVSVSPSKRVRITGARIEATQIDAPGWVYVPVAAPGESGLPFTGGFWQPRSLDLIADIEKGTLSPSEGEEAGWPIELSPDKPSLEIVVSSHSCTNNYQWRLVLDYQVPGEKRTRSLSAEPVRLYGRAARTHFVQGYQNRNGGISGATFVRSGVDERCVDDGVTQVMRPLPPRFR